MKQVRQFVSGVVIVVFILCGVLVGFTFGMMRRTRMPDQEIESDPKFHYGEQVKVSRGFNKGRHGRILDFNSFSGYTVIVDRRLDSSSRKVFFVPSNRETELIHATEQQLELVDEPELAPPLPDPLE